MSPQKARYTSPKLSVAEGWSLTRLTQPSRLFGANGMRIGPDGRIYVAQVSGSQISAIDVETGAIEAISPKGGDIVAPDDLVFDPRAISMPPRLPKDASAYVHPTARTRVVQGDMPVANPITFHQGRLIAGECRSARASWSLTSTAALRGSSRKTCPMPNAFEVGPDGKLYFPVMGTNEIWRVSLEGGSPEKVAGDLGVPDSVKFDAQGYIVSTQVHSGQVLRIDPRTGEQDRAREPQARPGQRTCSSASGSSFRTFRDTSPRSSTAARQGSSCPMASTGRWAWRLTGTACCMWPMEPFLHDFARDASVSSPACCSVPVIRVIHAAWPQRGGANSS